MAEIINNFFSTVAADLANNMPPSDGLSVTTIIISNCNSMFLYPITKSECIDVISKLTIYIKKTSSIFLMPFN